jgi:hypothetical protein
MHDVAVNDGHVGSPPDRPTMRLATHVDLLLTVALAYDTRRFHTEDLLNRLLAFEQIQIYS